MAETRWFHFEVWVKVGSEPGAVERMTVESLADSWAEVIFKAGEDHKFDPEISGTMAGPSPGWLVHDD